MLVQTLQVAVLLGALNGSSPILAVPDSLHAPGGEPCCCQMSLQPVPLDSQGEHCGCLACPSGATGLFAVLPSESTTPRRIAESADFGKPAHLVADSWNQIPRPPPPRA